MTKPTPRSSPAAVVAAFIAALLATPPPESQSSGSESAASQSAESQLAESQSAKKPARQSQPERGQPAPAPDAREVRISFHAVDDNQPFSCTRESANKQAQPTGDTQDLRLHDLRFFIHELSLTAADSRSYPVTLTPDQRWQTKNVALLDFEDGSGACRGGSPQTRTFVTGTTTAPEGGEVTLAFRLGVPFTQNHQDPGNAEGPLALTAMHWNWRGGYKFLRAGASLHVQSSADTDEERDKAIPSPKVALDRIIPVKIHLGSTGCTGELGAIEACKNPNRPLIRVQGFDPARHHVEIDARALMLSSIAGEPGRGTRDSPDAGNKPDNAAVGNAQESPDIRQSGCMGEPEDPGCLGVFALLGLGEDSADAPDSIFRCRPRVAAGKETEREADAADTTAPDSDPGNSLTAKQQNGSSGTTASTYQWNLPKHFPPPPMPADNPLTAEKAELGRHLFYDPQLSSDESMSCASCHVQELAFTDGKAHSTGVTGQTTPRGSMSLANVGYSPRLTWANPLIARLEHQARLPMFGEEPVEMGLAGLEDELIRRIREDARYTKLFAEAFPEDPEVTLERILQGIASFQRTLVSASSPYDRYLQGDREALNESQLRGMDLFFSERLECFHCHGGFTFTDSVDHEGKPFEEFTFHNTGLYNIDGEGGYPPGNTGIHDITGQPEDMGRFKAPTLRNIEVTAPYMHDGSITTLEEAINHYAEGGRILENGPWAGVGADSPLKSEFVPGFILNEREEEDLIAFLKALTDEKFLKDPALASPD